MIIGEITNPKNEQDFEKKLTILDDSLKRRDYDPYKIPADIEVAEIHGRSTLLYNIKYEAYDPKNKVKKCLILNTWMKLSGSPQEDAKKLLSSTSISTIMERVV